MRPELNFGHVDHSELLHQRICRCMGVSVPDDDLEDHWKDLRPTIGTLYGPAMEVTTEPEAKELFERLVARAMAYGMTREAAERQERANIGYYSGYYSSEVQTRVEKLFGAVHPIFGSASGRTPLTSEQVLQAGMRIGERSQRSQSPVFCEHANEMPQVCPCDRDCYCKFNSCRPGSV